jgi:hypothetical protein
MTPELWQRLKPLFLAALKEDIQTRATFVDAACGNDLELKMHLKLLLDAEQQNTYSRDKPGSGSRTSQFVVARLFRLSNGLSGHRGWDVRRR